MDLHSNVILIVAAYIACQIPVLGKFISVLNTLAHEIGHAITALLFRGKVQSISLFANTSGVALTSSRSRIGQILTSLAGYPAASITSILCFVLIHYHYTFIVLYGFVGMTLFALVFWIRNFYGWIWALSFLGLSGWLIYSGTSILQDQMTIFLSSVIYTQSISSALAIFWLSLTRPQDAGDATNLAQATWIPSIFWGLFFLAQSLYIAYIGFIYFI